MSQTDAFEVAAHEVPDDCYPVINGIATPGEIAYYAFHARQPGGNGDLSCPQATPWEALFEHERETWEHVAAEAHAASLPLSPMRVVMPDEIDEDPPSIEEECEAAYDEGCNHGYIDGHCDGYDEGYSVAAYDLGYSDAEVEE
jgi:hypothetical protein